MKSMRVLAAVFSFLVLSWSAEAAELPWLVGAAKSDITGPITRLVMFGYGNSRQVGAGLHTRLWARAIHLEEPGTGRFVTLVTADLGMIPRALKLEVLRRLREAAPEAGFDDSRLVLSATHTHASPGGLSHYLLFNGDNRGFSRENFEHVAKGVAEAALRARVARRPSTLGFGERAVTGLNLNQSLSGYLANRDALEYAEPTNTTMSQLEARDADGRLLAIQNWFSVHTTSLTRENRLVSGDNKGIAARLLERELGPAFVAAFANGDEGDVSSAVDVPDAPAARREQDEYAFARWHGQRQADAAIALLSARARALPEGVDVRSVWVRMPGLAVPDGSRLCHAAIGYSFAAGSEDGPSGIAGFREGMLAGEPIPPDAGAELRVLRALGPVIAGTRADRECQHPKPILARVGEDGLSLTPDTLPFQLVRLGDLAIAAVPAELTTMAGRRLRAAILRQLAPIGIRSVVITGLANSYSGYVTTPEEYRLQQYEGAFTLFGPRTLPAYILIFERLARALARGESLPGVAPPAFPDWLERRGLAPARPEDRVPLGSRFGAWLALPQPWARAGDAVSARLQAADPGRVADAFRFTVERLDGHGDAEPGRSRVVEDADPETRLLWTRVKGCRGCSEVALRWDVPAGQASGLYRFVYQGLAFPRLGERTAFSAVSPPFVILE